MAITKQRIKRISERIKQLVVFDGHFSLIELHKAADKLEREEKLKQKNEHNKK